MTKGTGTFGPLFDEALDGERIRGQMGAILKHTLGATWLTLAEIAEGTDYPEASVSAQLRHLRKPRFGGYRVEKRRRSRADGKPGGTWEYRVREPEPGAQRKEAKEQPDDPHKEARVENEACAKLLDERSREAYGDGMMDLGKRYGKVATQIRDRMKGGRG